MNWNERHGWRGELRAWKIIVKKRGQMANSMLVGHFHQFDIISLFAGKLLQGKFLVKKKK